jgi:hypothetical protein
VRVGLIKTGLDLARESRDSRADVDTDREELFPRVSAVPSDEVSTALEVRARVRTSIMRALLILTLLGIGTPTPTVIKTSYDRTRPFRQQPPAIRVRIRSDSNDNVSYFHSVLSDRPM